MGCYPRDLTGFRGVFLTHFIHSNTQHLFNNSIPLFVLLSTVCFFYKESALKVLLWGGFLTGVLTWCIARESYHIGASGVVYLLFSFIFFSGIIKKYYRLVAVSLDDYFSLWRNDLVCFSNQRRHVLGRTFVGLSCWAFLCFFVSK